MNLSEIVRGAVKAHLGGFYLPLQHDPLVQRIVHALGPRIRAAIEKGDQKIACSTGTEVISHMNSVIMNSAHEICRIRQPATDGEFQQYAGYVSAGIATGWSHHVLTLRDQIPMAPHLALCHETLDEIFVTVTKDPIQNG